MSEIEIYGALRNLPEKGHDRLFINEKQDFAGVFDGAGGEELSQSIVRELPSFIDTYNHLRPESSKDFMAEVVSEMDSLMAGHICKAAGALACADLLNDRLQLTIANAGDTSLYIYDHSIRHLSRLAHTATTYRTDYGKRFVDTSEFLGNRRSAVGVAHTISRLALPLETRWSIIGLTDGIQDNSDKGISYDALGQLIKDVPSDELPDAIMDNVEPYDDAAVFVMSVQADPSMNRSQNHKVSSERSQRQKVAKNKEPATPQPKPEPETGMFPEIWTESQSNTVKTYPDTPAKQQPSRKNLRRLIKQPLFRR